MARRRNLRNGLLRYRSQELVKTINWDQVLQGQTLRIFLSSRRCRGIPNHLEFDQKRTQFPKDSIQPEVDDPRPGCTAVLRVRDFNDLDSIRLRRY
jgi:hypothetical protein